MRNPQQRSAAPRSANQATSPGRPHSGLLTPRARAQYVCVSLTQDVPLSFGGSEAPAAHATLTSIGGLGPNNASLSERISAVLQAKFGIPANRLYIDFRDVAGSNMASAARSRVLSSACCPADAHVHRRAGTERRFETHDTRYFVRARDTVLLQANWHGRGSRRGCSPARTGFEPHH